MGTRRKSRELALQMLFQADMGKQAPDAVRKSFWAERTNVDEDVRGFAEDLFRVASDRLTEVDGLGASTVLTVLSETGPDLAAKFASDKHFAAWTTLAPRKHQSGKRTKFPAQTASRVAKAFRLAARALLNSKSVLGDFLRRLRARLGIGTAIRATACKLAKLFYRLITKGEAYRRESTEAEEAKQRERQVRALERKAHDLGMQVVPA